MMLRGLLVVGALVGGLVQPRTIVVRDGDLTTPLPVVSTGRGDMVRIEESLEILRLAMLRVGSDRVRLIGGRADVELQAGVAVAKMGTKSFALSAAPAFVDGALLIPVGVLTDVLPQVSSAYTYDAAGRVLRVTRAVADAGSASAAPSRPQPPTVAPPRRTTPSPAPAGPRATPHRQLVVVDAGHGGPDRGMTGPLGSKRKVFEKDITLGIARELQRELRSTGVEVLMTRSTDTLIALRDRGRIANRAGATLFVSIHVNAANPRWRQPGGARGYETYFLSEAKTEDERRVAELENEAAKYDGEEEVEPGDPLAFILNDMKQNEYLRESSDLATTLQRSMKAVHPGPDRGVKQAGFMVLVRAFMPAVLVETGFGSNPAESAYLASPTGQRQLARALAGGVVDYLARLDRKSSGGVP